MLNAGALTTLLPREEVINLRYLRVGELRLEKFFSKGHQLQRPEEFVLRLPSSLETLYLYINTKQEIRKLAKQQSNKEITTLLRILYATVKPRLVNLKEVSLVGQNSILSIYLYAFTKLYQGFADARICFLLIATNQSYNLTSMQYKNVEPRQVYVNLQKQSLIEGCSSSYCQKIQ